MRDLYTINLSFTGLKNRLGKAFVDIKPKLGKMSSFRSHFEYVPIWSS